LDLFQCVCVSNKMESRQRLCRISTHVLCRPRHCGTAYQQQASTRSVLRFMFLFRCTLLKFEKKFTATKTNLQGDDFTCKHATVYKSRKPTPYRLADAQRGRQRRKSAIFRGRRAVPMGGSCLGPTT